jgi:polyribonucleotide nucleotidyltransferase
VAQAKAGRIRALGEMAKRLPVNSRARTTHRDHADPTDRIREVISSGGKVIREIVPECPAKSTSTTKASIASERRSDQRKPDAIWSMAAEPEEGMVYTGTVT